MELLKKEQNQAKKLGFEKLETAEMVTSLNKVLATYQVFFHKLQNFHWNTVGGDFFDVHELTEELYKNALENIDEIAERIRVFGQIPEGKLSEYLQNSIVKECSTQKSADFMISNLIQDLEHLTETILHAHEQASLNGDVGTGYMMSKMLKEIETYHWKLSAWANRKFAV